MSRGTGNIRAWLFTIAQSKFSDSEPDQPLKSSWAGPDTFSIGWQQPESVEVR